jgi:hypothetical protein
LFFITKNLQKNFTSPVCEREVSFFKYLLNIIFTRERLKRFQNAFVVSPLLIKEGVGGGYQLSFFQFFKSLFFDSPFLMFEQTFKNIDNNLFKDAGYLII